MRSPKGILEGEGDGGGPLKPGFGLFPFFGFWINVCPKRCNLEFSHQFADYELLFLEINTANLDLTGFDNRPAGPEIGNKTASIDNYPRRNFPRPRTMGVADNDKSCLRPENPRQLNGAARNL